MTDADAQTHTDEAVARLAAELASPGPRHFAAADVRTVLDTLADAQTQVAGLKTERAGWRSIAGIDEIEAERDAERARADTAEAERDELRAQVADYENRIAWHTTCGQCATVLDAGIRDHERAEKAEERVAELEAEFTGETEWTVGYVETDGRTYHVGEYTEAEARHHAARRQGNWFPAWRRVTNWHRADPAPDASSQPEGDADDAPTE